MSEDEHGPVDVTAFLFGDVTAADAVEALESSLSGHGALGTATLGARRLTVAARKSVEQEVAKVASGLMELDLGDALVAAWRQYSALRESARRTVESPGSEEVVSLAAHRVTSVYRPRVDLLVDGVKVNSFEFELTAVFDLTGVAAVISAGRLVALRGGKCRLAVSLKLEGLQLVERHRSVELGWLLPLRRPVVLAAAAQAGAAQAGARTIPEQRPAVHEEPLPSSSGNG